MTRGINTFTWSGAVKSLTLLLLRTATSKTEIGNQIFSLSGAKDSAASKLDFALGKKPAWLLDMFGVDSKGMALSNRLFSRNNPERKRPGPVSIFLNTNFFNLQCLQILDKNGNKLEEAKITEIADFIESDLTGKNSLNSNISKITKKTHEFVKEDSSVQLNSPEHSFFGMPDTLSINALRAILTSSSEKQIEGSKDLFRQSSPILKEMFRKEILKVLRHRDIFGDIAFTKTCKGLLADTSFTNNDKRFTESLFEMGNKLSPSSHLGILNKIPSLSSVMQNNSPIKLVVPADLVGSVAILYFIKFLRKAPIEIDFQYAHSPEIIDSIMKGSLDSKNSGIIISAHPAAQLLADKSRHDFRPIMFMPRITRRIIARKSSKSGNNRLNKGCFLALRGIPATSSSYLARLIERQLINSKGSKFQKAEPFEQTFLLKEGDPDLRSILVFPHYNANILLNNCELVDNGEDYSDLTTVSTIFFAGSELLTNQLLKNSLEIELRNAWLELAKGGDLLDLTLGLMLADITYVSFLERTGGFDSSSYDNPTAINSEET